MHPAGIPPEGLSTCANKSFPAIVRGFKKPGSDLVWTAGNQVDEKLLPRLNQACFRCHSSFSYHVFEKASVAQRKGGIASYVDSGFMPPDRDLDKPTKDTIVDLVKKLP